MDLYPAIDLRHGRVVRLSQGEAERETVYDADPAAVAERFADEGASWIHVVDLDRAFGDGDNAAAVARIVRAAGGRVRVQLGGGLRSLDRIEASLALGVTRLVLGTAAVGDPVLVRRTVELAGPGRIAAGIDARDGFVAVRGWREIAGVRAESVVARLLADGVDTVIYTDIARDGMLVGPDLAGARSLQSLGARVIVSGGVATLDDLRAVRDAGLAGAVIGRALYEGRFTLADALRALQA